MAKRQVMLRIYAPPEYWKLTEAERSQYSNGCGTEGIVGLLVPDHLFFLSIEIACAIHDFMYELGETQADKEIADRVFLNNMLRIIKTAGGLKFIQKIRVHLAYVYYDAVVKFGGPYFWDGKNRPVEFKQTAVAI